MAQLLMFRLLIKRGVLFGEALHAASGVNQLVFAGKERVAMRTNFNVEIFANGGCGLNGMTTGTSDCDFVQFRMNALFHIGGDS